MTGHRHELITSKNPLILPGTFWPSGHWWFYRNVDYSLFRYHKRKFYFRMLCPRGHFVTKDVLSPRMFCPQGCFVRRTYCPRSLFPRDFLSSVTFCFEERFVSQDGGHIAHGHFDPGHFVSVRFVLGRFVSQHFVRVSVHMSALYWYLLILYIC